MASSILFTDESTLICPNTQLLNIKGIDTSVTTDILLPATNADVLEEFSECPENESLYVSSKNHDICINDEIDDDAQSFETPRKHNQGNMSLIVKDSKSTPGLQKQLQRNLYMSVKNSLLQVKNICVFKQMAKVLVLHSIKITCVEQSY